MRLPIPVSRPEDPPIRLPVPDALQVGFGVYVRATPNHEPSRADLLTDLQSWLTDCVAEPSRSAMRAYLNSGFLHIDVGPRTLLPAPPLDSLRAMGAEGEVEARFTHADHLIVVTAIDSLGHARFGYWCAYGLAQAAARRLRGVVYDPLCMRLLPLSERPETVGATAMVPPETHIARVATADSHGLLAMQTLGMRKYGLPELVMRGLTPEFAPESEGVLNSAARAILAAVIDHAHTTDGEATLAAIGPVLPLAPFPIRLRRSRNRISISIVREGTWVGPGQGRG